MHFPIIGPLLQAVMDMDRAQIGNLQLAQPVEQGGRIRAAAIGDPQA